MVSFNEMHHNEILHHNDRRLEPWSASSVYGLNWTQKQYTSKMNEVDISIKKLHFIGHGQLDSILGSYSIPGIDFIHIRP